MEYELNRINATIRNLRNFGGPYGADDVAALENSVQSALSEVADSLDTIVGILRELSARTNNLDE